MKKIVKVIKKIFQTLCDCIVPVLPILIGVGMIKVLLIIVGPLVLNILSEDASTYVVLKFVADAGFYFLPIYIGFSSAETFKTQKYLGAVVGAMLISPAFINFVSTNQQLTFLNLPIAMTDYSNQVLPSIIAVWIMSYIYKFLDKHIPTNLKSLLVPLITILLMIPITLCAIGPLGVFLGDNLVKLIMLLKDLGPIGNAIMCAIIPFITIFGLSGANLSSMLLLASSGVDPILFFSNVIYNNAVGIVALVIYIRNKKSDNLASAITSSVAGISEPAMFTVIMKDSKALIALIIGCFFGGLYSGITGVKAYAMANFGIFGTIATIGQDSSIINAFISIIIACVISFVICLLLHPKKKYE